MKPVPRLALGVVLLLAPAIRVRADIVITETTSDTIGSKSFTGVRSTFIKGAQMRIEDVHGDKSTATLFDLTAGTIVDLNVKRKQAEIRDISARTAEVERLYPLQTVSVTLTPTGKVKDLAGTSCTEYAFAITVPMMKGGQPFLHVTGAAWVATAAPGAADYDTFAKAAVQRQLVSGYVSSNRILLALTRGQTALSHALADLHGIPYLIDATTTFDGRLSGLLNKTASGTSTRIVTRVEAGPLPDTRFVIPDGWTREKK